MFTYSPYNHIAMANPSHAVTSSSSLLDSVVMTADAVVPTAMDGRIVCVTAAGGRLHRLLVGEAPLGERLHCEGNSDKSRCGNYCYMHGVLLSLPFVGTSYHPILHCLSIK